MYPDADGATRIEVRLSVARDYVLLMVGDH